MGNIIIPSHFLFDILAYYIGFRYYIYLRNKKGDFIDSQTRWSLIIGAIIGAFIFSRLIAALEEPSLFLNPRLFIYYLQGQTIVGGLLGGILGIEITKKVIKEKRSTGDVYVYPLILGIVIGRIGCFLTGVSDRTVGIASNLPWAFDQGDGIPRHPTSLYEIIFLLLLWFILLKVQKRYVLKNGSTFKIFILSYLLFRFLIEFIKPITPLVFGLSSIQLACLIGIVYYITIIYKKGLIVSKQE